MQKSLQDHLIGNFSDEMTDSGKGAFIDPAWIPIFVELAKVLIEIINRCQENGGFSLRILRDPSVLQRFVLKRSIRKNMPRSEYRKHGREVYRAFLKTGMEAPDEVLMEAINGNELDY
jgi:hypothetical protein